jgi:hypothetical protein
MKIFKIEFVECPTTATGPEVTASTVVCEWCQDPFMIIGKGDGLYMCSVCRFNVEMDAEARE